MTLQTPVVFIVFNRPSTTERVFAEIAKAKPQKLLVIADGPRANHPSDTQRCEAARAIIDRVDWPCEVLKNYSNTNLGCGRRPATGLSWAFELVEEAIILEDDCVPHPTFFRFCEELLETFRHDERVMHISGNNFQFGQKRTAYSYYFSCHNLCWGWASWRRAWRHFDMGVKLWPSLRETSWLLDIVEHPRAVDYWQEMFERAYVSAGDIDYWDYQWTFACWAQSGLSILPTATLISNVGFGEEATHTKIKSNRLANLPTAEMVFPLKHPSYMIRDEEADRNLIKHVVLPSRSAPPSLYRKLRSTCISITPEPVRKSVFYFRSKLV